MIQAVIIEDEKSAQDNLLGTLKELPFEVNICAVLSTIQESIDFFKAHPSIDIIFSDVQLPGGLSFDIFREVDIKVPVIFVTGFDRFMLYAFENNGIDYLLKPVQKDELLKALLKYKMLENHFNAHSQALNNLLEFTGAKKRTRLIVKKGIENISIKMEDIVMFYTENKMVYLVDKNEKKFIVDRTLNELEAELETSVFFRANRQYIINLNFVKCYKPYEKVKLQVDLNISEKNYLIIISQITAPYFRKWIAEA